MQVKEAVATTTRSVKNAYWDLVFAINSLDVQRQSLDLAQRSLKENRARVEIGTMAPIDALINAVAARGLNPLPIFVNSLKEAVAADLIRSLYSESAPDVTLNCTGFAVSQPGAAHFATPFDAGDHPVLQVVLSSETQAQWQVSPRGLSPRDLAMQVALPELDGRILTRAISWKSAAHYDDATQCTIVAPQPLNNRVDFVAELAANWVKLRRTNVAERRVALVLANYPNRAGRIGNGVGLDTPAGTIEVLKAMRDAGYSIDGVPQDGDQLMAALTARKGRSG